MSVALLWMAALAAAAGYGWWLTGLEPFAWPSTLAVSVPAVATIAAATRRGGRRTSLRDWVADVVRTCRRAMADTATDRQRRARAAVLWGFLILLFASIQLFAYFSGWGAARSDYPTLSWILDHVESRAGRSALFVAWLAFGVRLVRR